jgi:transposase
MQVYLGIDWSRHKHDAVLMNREGAAIAELTFAHDRDGFERLHALRGKLKIPPADCVVGLETAHSLLVDFLWDQGYEQVYVVPPRAVKSSRTRNRQSGARSDPSDAYVLADMLRTDRGRLQPWFPDAAFTRQIRAKISLAMHLTRDIGRVSNRLREVLWRYYPQATEIFSSLKTNISLAFLQAYPTPRAAAELSFEAFRAFARVHRYPQPKRLARCFARLQEPHPEPNPATVSAYAQETPLLAGILKTLVDAKKQVLREIQELFHQHPDAHIFQSLPGTGPLLAPALLAKFGDDRRRFPTASSLQALAGTCPVTKSSGKWKTVRFRFACDREFRHIVQQWARSSVSCSAWASAYLERLIPRVRSMNHAYRCLANRWLAIAWRLWQTGEAYDEAYHLQQVAMRRQPVR